MQVALGFSELKDAPPNCVATIGNFDGVHLGHRQILQALREKAEKIGGTPTVVTFRPHPQIALRPEKKMELLNTYAEKLEILQSLGIALVIEQPFSREFSNTSAADFVEEYLLGRLKLRALFLGYDFAFGKERAGGADLIRQTAAKKNVEVVEMPACEFKGEAVSSSRIRRCLEVGDLPLTNELLGREFFVRGVVVKGVGRGKTIQIPTANLSLEARKLPRLGVYATRTIFDGKSFDSVTNVGISPTFHKEGEVAAVVESHIFDFTQDIYGSTLEVKFLEFLRPEKKFNGVTELVQQIHQDIAKVKSIFRSD